MRNDAPSPPIEELRACHRPAPLVVDADDCRSLLLHAGDQALLDARVICHGAMAVEMIFAEIDQNADRRVERRGKIDLVGRTLDDMHTAVRRRIKRQDGGADIAAELRIQAGRRRE